MEGDKRRQTNIGKQTIHIKTQLLTKPWVSIEPFLCYCIPEELGWPFGRMPLGLFAYTSTKNWV